MGWEGVCALLAGLPGSSSLSQVVSTEEQRHLERRGFCLPLASLYQPLPGHDNCFPTSFLSQVMASANL